MFSENSACCVWVQTLHHTTERTDQEDGPSTGEFFRPDLSDLPAAHHSVEAPGSSRSTSASTQDPGGDV